MSKAKREKKNKINLKVWIPIICIIVIGITFYMIYDIQKKIQKNNQQNTTNVNENKTENEIANQDSNTMENSIQENSTQNETANVEENIDISNNATTSINEAYTSTPAKPAVTDQKQKAIELVKKEWGNDDTVNYVFDYINENGEYVVAVKDRATATVKYYFRVNLETQTVELD